MINHQNAFFVSLSKYMNNFDVKLKRRQLYINKRKLHHVTWKKSFGENCILNLISFIDKLIVELNFK